MDRIRLSQIQSNEHAFPQAAGQAFAWARQQAIQRGRSVLISKDGVVLKLAPDGTQTVVKHISPPVPVSPGTYVLP